MSLSFGTNYNNVCAAPSNKGTTPRASCLNTVLESAAFTDPPLTYVRVSALVCLFVVGGGRGSRRGRGGPAGVGGVVGRGGDGEGAGLRGRVRPLRHVARPKAGTHEVVAGVMMNAVESWLLLLLVVVVVIVWWRRWR